MFLFLLEFISFSLSVLINANTYAICTKFHFQNFFTFSLPKSFSFYFPKKKVCFFPPSFNWMKMILFNKYLCQQNIASKYDCQWAVSASSKRKCSELKWASAKVIVSSRHYLKFHRNSISIANCRYKVMFFFFFFKNNSHPRLRLFPHKAKKPTFFSLNWQIKQRTNDQQRKKKIETEMLMA